MPRSDWVSTCCHIQTMVRGRDLDTFPYQYCADCGQRWELASREWSPIPPWVDDPHGLAILRSRQPSGGNR